MPPIRFTVQKVNVQFMVNLDLFYAVHDGFRELEVGFFYDERHARIAAEAMEKSIGHPRVLDADSLERLLA
jgi:hypothetical protein